MGIDHNMNKFIEISVFSFFSFIPIFPKYYSLVALALVIIGVSSLIKQHSLRGLSLHDDRVILTVCLLMASLVFVIAVYVHDEGFRGAEKPFKIMILTSIMIVFARYAMTDVFLWNVVTYSGLIVGAFFFLEVFLGNLDRAGSVLNPINSAVFVSVLVVILAMAPKNGNFKPWLVFVSQILCVNAVILTGTRSAVIVLVLVLTVVVYRDLRYLGCRRLKFRNLISIVLLLISITPLAFLESRLTTMGSQLDANNHNSITDRIHLYSHAASIIPNGLPLGVGQRGYNASLSQYGKVHLLEHLDNYNHPHNEILNYTAKYGILGALSLLVFYIGPAVVFLRGYRRNSKLSSTGVYVLYIFVGNGLFHSLFSHNSMIMIYVIIVILMSSIIYSSRQSLEAL